MENSSIADIQAEAIQHLTLTKTTRIPNLDFPSHFISLENNHYQCKAGEKYNYIYNSELGDAFGKCLS